jgi:hypothetical protein
MSHNFIQLESTISELSHQPFEGFKKDRRISRQNNYLGVIPGMMENKGLFFINNLISLYGIDNCAFRVI